VLFAAGVIPPKVHLLLGNRRCSFACGRKVICGLAKNSNVGGLSGTLAFEIVVCLVVAAMAHLGAFLSAVNAGP
jgi:hypothetical protein